MPFESHSLTAAELATIALATGTHNWLPNTFAYPGLGFDAAPLLAANDFAS